MKKHIIIIKSIIASGFLFAGVATASTQDSETDLIYGNGSVINLRVAGIHGEYRAVCNHQVR